MSCDQIYDEYGGRSASTAATIGSIQGVVGMLGLGGFWQPVDDSAITNIQNAYSQLQNKWQETYNEYNYTLNEWQTKFRNEQLDLLEAYQQFGQEMLSERIGKNSLYIAILFVALIIVIIYLILL